MRDSAIRLLASLVALAMVATAACTGQTTEQQVVATSSTLTTSTSSTSTGFDGNESIDEDNPAGTTPVVSNARDTVPIFPYAPDPFPFELSREALRRVGDCSSFNFAPPFAMLGPDRIDAIPEAYEAVLGGDMATLTKVLVGDELEPEGLPPLIVLAASTGCVESVEMLLGAGADPSTVDPFSRTSVVSAAVRSRNPAVVGLVVDAGADVDFVIEGESALHLAALLDLPGSVRVLLEAGADTDLRSAYGGVTPLTLASAHAGTEVVSVLLDAGATPLPMDLLAAASRIDDPSNAGSWPATAIVALLLESGLDPDERTDELPGSVRHMLEGDGKARAIEYIDYYLAYLEEAEL